MGKELDSIRLAIRVGNIEEARNELTLLVKANPEHGDAWRLLAETLDDDDQIAGCIEQAQIADARQADLALQPKSLYDDSAVTGTQVIPTPRKPVTRKKAAARRRARVMRLMITAMGVLFASAVCLLLGLIGTGLQSAQAAATLAVPIVIPSMTPTSPLPTLPPAWTETAANLTVTPAGVWTAPPTETPTPLVLPTRDPLQTEVTPAPTVSEPTRALPTAGPSNTPTATLAIGGGVQATPLATVAATATGAAWATATPLGPASLETTLPGRYNVIAGNPIDVVAVRVTRLSFRTRTLTGVQLLLEPNDAEWIFAQQDPGLQSEFSERLLADVARGLGAADTIVFVSTEFHTETLLPLFQRDRWFASRRDPAGGYVISHDLVRADLIAGVVTIQVWPGATEDAWR